MSSIHPLPHPVLGLLELCLLLCRQVLVPTDSLPVGLGLHPVLGRPVVPQPPRRIVHPATLRAGDLIVRHALVRDLDVALAAALGVVELPAVLAGVAVDGQAVAAGVHVEVGLEGVAAGAVVAALLAGVLAGAPGKE